MVDNVIRLSTSDLACDDHAGLDPNWSVVKSSPPEPQEEESDIASGDVDLYDDDLETDCAPPSLSAPPVNFGEIVIQDSTDVHIGNKTFYNGAVTIKQFVITKEDESKLGRLPPTPVSNGTLARSCSHLCEPTKDENNPKEQSKLRYLKSPYTVGGVLFVLLACVLLAVYFANGFSAKPEEVETLPTNASQRLITRGVWLSIYKLDADMPLVEKLPAPCLTLVESGTGTCTTNDYCKSTLRFMQNRDKSLGLPDIRYNFLVGGDGYLYEGIGWDKRGTQVCKALDSRCLSLQIIGDFSSEPPPPKQVQAVGLLVDLGIREGKLDSDLKVYLPDKLCSPKLAQAVEKWPGGDLDKRVQKYTQGCE